MFRRSMSIVACEPLADASHSPTAASHWARSEDEVAMSTTSPRLEMNNRTFCMVGLLRAAPRAEAVHPSLNTPRGPWTINPTFWP